MPPLDENEEEGEEAPKTRSSHRRRNRQQRFCFVDQTRKTILATKLTTSFINTLRHDYQDPLLHVHSKVEGTNEYTLLLYVPARAPFDLWDRDAKHGVKLVHAKSLYHR